MSARRLPVSVRTMRDEDYESVIRINRKHYPDQAPWQAEHFDSHREAFPDGQLVATLDDGQVVGYAASLILRWSDYTFDQSWNEFTASGFFTNHDPVDGLTLYGADVMVDPTFQRRGIGKALYKARFDLCREKRLSRIRFGARMVGYHRYAEVLTAREYLLKVIDRELTDPTVSFQLHRGFRVIALVDGYLGSDPKSLGYAAIMEWINHQVAQRRDYRGRDPAFGRPRKHPRSPPIRVEP